MVQDERALSGRYGVQRGEETMRMVEHCHLWLSMNKISIAKKVYYETKNMCGRFETAFPEKTLQ